MKIVKKILWAAVKIIAGIFAFYLFLSLCLIPLLTPWILGSQASKILKHPVQVRRVFFNPFLLRLNINGLKILDADKQVILGFDRCWGDVSFTSLLKKAYRVESLGLRGLVVNVVLSDKGEINLLGLVPAEPLNPAQADKQPVTAAAQQPADAGTASSTGAGAQPLPLVTVDLISISRSTIRFTDRSVNPNFTTALSGIELRVKGLSTAPEAEAQVSFQAQLDDKGLITTEVLMKPLALPLTLECVFKLNDYALGVLTPYVGKYTGHTVKEGKLNLSMDYRIADNQLKAGHKVFVQSFNFGDRVESKDALKLPFGLALALLEDSRDNINLSLPVTGDMSKPDFHYFRLIGQVLRTFFFKLVTKPFSFLGSIAGVESGSEELGYIRFAPGRTELSDSEKEKLRTIVKVLAERPRLSLQVRGVYDPVADWKVIKEDVFNRDFAALKEESRRPESWVYQTLYQRRFGITDLWKLTRSFRAKGGYDEENLNAEIKRRLIEEGTADTAALKAFADERAKAVYDFIIDAGFDAQRVSTGEPQESQASAGFVPLELVLTVYGDSSAEGPLFSPEAKGISSDQAQPQ